MGTVGGSQASHAWPSGCGGEGCHKQASAALCGRSPEGHRREAGAAMVKRVLSGRVAGAGLRVSAW